MMPQTTRLVDNPNLNQAMVPTRLSSPAPPAISIAKFISDQPYVNMIDTLCATMKDLKKIHACLIKTGLINDTFAASRVLAFSASPTAGDINYAYLVFTRIHDKNPFVWNTVIRGFSQSSFPEKAITCFVDMLEFSSVQPQRLTYPSVFKAYASFGLARDGAQLHGRVIKEGLESDPFIRNTVLHMYASCGCLYEAWRVFDEEMEFDVVAWNSMIVGLAKSGQIDEAKNLFDEMLHRNEVSWNSMISGYVRNGKLTDALELFQEMQENNIKPNEFTMVSLLNACACLGASIQGKWIHDYMVKNSFELNGIAITAVIDMYCKCGCVEEGMQVFRSVPKKQLSCWNSMMLGLANNCFEEEAMRLFHQLECSNLEPDSVSFIGVLTACNHTGMVDKARGYFSLMREKYRIEPSIKHYNCMVDVLGGAGLLEEAETLIKSMPTKPDAIIWGSLLSACRKHGNIEMAERAAEGVMKLDPDESCGYVLMSNAYAASGQFEDAIKQRLFMKKRHIEKEPGCSLIEVDLEVHEFVSSGRMHPKSPEVYGLLDVLNWNARELQLKVGSWFSF